MVKRQSQALLVSLFEEMVASAKVFISEGMIVPAKMIVEKKERHG
jgi:hypothetical protein